MSGIIWRLFTDLTYLTSCLGDVGTRIGSSAMNYLVIYSLFGLNTRYCSNTAALANCVVLNSVVNVIILLNVLSDV